MANIWRPKQASRHEVRATARAWVYLGTVDRLRAALVREYGDEVPIPPNAFLQAILDRRAGEFRRFREIAERREIAA